MNSLVIGNKKTEQSTNVPIIIKPTPLIFPFDTSPLIAKALPLSFGKNGNFNFSKIKQITNANIDAIAIYCCTLVKRSKI